LPASEGNVNIAAGTDIEFIAFVERPLDPALRSIAVVLIKFGAKIFLHRSSREQQCHRFSRVGGIAPRFL